MGFKEYTSCVEPRHFVDLSFTLNVGIFNILLLVLIYGFIAVAAVTILGGPALIISAMALVAAAITFVLWWLYGRLICLDEADRNCAIVGMVFTKGNSDPLKKSGDNDFTMNLLLPPGPLDPLEPTNKATLDSRPPTDFSSVQPQGYLIAENPKVSGVSRGYVKDGDSFRHLKVLHCEFEGNGVKIILDALYGLMATLTVALIIILTGSPFPVLGFILALLLFLFIVVDKIFIAQPGDPGSGSPLDVNPHLGSLADCDIVVVQGDWIYDSLHEGWNEIHPVKRCEKLGTLEIDKNDGQYKWSNFTWTDPITNTPFKIDTPENVEALRQHWCDVWKGVVKAEEGGNQTNPEHGWQVHPSVDGCTTIIIT